MVQNIGHVAQGELDSCLYQVTKSVTVSQLLLRAEIICTIMQTCVAKRKPEVNNSFITYRDVQKYELDSGLYFNFCLF